MSSIKDRVVEDDRGHVILLARDHGHTLVLAKSARSGRLVKMIAGDGQATFSNNVGRNKPTVIAPRNAALTRAECAVLLSVDIEAAAKILDENEVPRLAAYDGPRVRALVQSRAQQ
jgi:hypothetical protein